MLSRVKNLLNTQRLKGVFVPLSSNEAKTQPMASTHAHDLAMFRSSRRSSALKGMGSLNRWFVHRWCAPYVRGNWRISWNVQIRSEVFRPELSDNLHAYKTLKGKRLINSFGALRGVEVPEELTDDDLDDDLPYMLMLYTYRKGSGYNFSEQWTEDLSWNITSKAPKATGLHRATAIPKTKAKPMLSLDQMLQFAFNLTAARSSDSPKHFKGYSLHFAMQSRS